MRYRTIKAIELATFGPLTGGAWAVFGWSGAITMLAFQIGSIWGTWCTFKLQSESRERP